MNSLIPRIMAVAFAVFAILSLLGIMHFPDIMLVIVLVNPPSWASLVITFVIPLILILFSVVFFFSRRIGALGLGAIAVFYGAMHAWAIIELPIWKFLFESELAVSPGLIEFKITFGMIVFFVLSAYMFKLARRERSRS